MNAISATKRFPAWLKQRAPASADVQATADVLASHGLNTVCNSARCPNVGFCMSRRTATFMILGTTCTRACSFCAVAKGSPNPPDPDEPRRLASAAASLGIRHVVITSVTRDDLADGGAGHFVECISAVRENVPHARVEILIPDFAGSGEAIATVAGARPDVLNHNIETVPRLYGAVRPGASYSRSLGIIKTASEAGVITKSGLMVGLGEERQEIREVLRDLFGCGCKIITIGQYLPPTRTHLPVKCFVEPEQFASYRDEALRMGFRAAASGPLVRSSFMAGDLCEEALSCRTL